MTKKRERSNKIDTIKTKKDLRRTKSKLVSREMTIDERDNILNLINKHNPGIVEELNKKNIDTIRHKLRTGKNPTKKAKKSPKKLDLDEDDESDSDEHESDSDEHEWDSDEHESDSESITSSNCMSDEEDEISERTIKELGLKGKKLDEHMEKLRSIHDASRSNKVSIHMVILNNFNQKDTIWFYDSLKRLDELEGIDRFRLEDQIKNKYRIISSLKKNNMYGINMIAERDCIGDISQSSHSQTVKSILISRMLGSADDSPEEYIKSLNWMDTILSIPTKIGSSTINKNETLDRLWNKLTENLYGMDHVAEEILQAVSTILNDSTHTGYILTLLGPPGCGKTTISAIISEVIGMGFGHISCGSIKDQSVIMGHSSTYIGSRPGLLTQIMIRSKQLDNVIILDEMDKLPDQQMLPILLNILDPTQNNRFNDAYCPEIDIDLSKNMFIPTVNSVDGFDQALKDRLKIVKIDGYTIDQKVQIVMRHTIPRISKRININVGINMNVVKHYVQEISPAQSGVREVERFFETIYQKIKLIRDSKSVRERYNLNEKILADRTTKIDKELIECLRTDRRSVQN